MFKMLILQTLYNLADEQVEYRICDRLSFARFLRFASRTQSRMPPRCDVFGSGCRSRGCWRRCSTALTISWRRRASKPGRDRSLMLPSLRCRFPAITARGIRRFQTTPARAHEGQCNQALTDEQQANNRTLSKIRSREDRLDELGLQLDALSAAHQRQGRCTCPRLKSDQREVKQAAGQHELEGIVHIDFLMRHQHVGISATIHISELKNWIFQVSARLPEISPSTLERLSPDKVMINNRIYLYSSISSPVRGETNMDAYMKKLAILADLEIGDPERILTRPPHRVRRLRWNVRTVIVHATPGIENRRRQVG